MICKRKLATIMGHQQYINEMTQEKPDTVADDKVGKLIKHQLLRFARKRRALCKNGMYLAIDKNGVHGTKDAKNPYAELQILSIGSDMLAIWGTRAALYLAIDATTGNIYTTPEEGRHCVFVESLMPDFYNIYESYKSVCEQVPQCIELNTQNKLEMTPVGHLPGRNGQFILEICAD